MGRLTMNPEHEKQIINYYQCDKHNCYTNLLDLIEHFVFTPREIENLQTQIYKEENTLNTPLPENQLLKKNLVIPVQITEQVKSKIYHDPWVKKFPPDKYPRFTNYPLELPRKIYNQGYIHYTTRNKNDKQTIYIHDKKGKKIKTINYHTTIK